MLPALAALYGVSADDILAGETLTDRRRGVLAEETAARRKRLLARLRMRFDICFVMALALAVLAAQRIRYVSWTALVISIAAIWTGYILVAHPIRYGGVEADGALWRNLYRKLLAALALQWYALLRLSRIGSTGLADAVSSGEWRAMMVLAVRAGIFCLGTLAIWGALQWRLRRLAGKGIWIVPVWVMLLGGGLSGGVAAGGRGLPADCGTLAGPVPQLGMDRAAPGAAYPAGRGPCATAADPADRAGGRGRQRPGTAGGVGADQAAAEKNTGPPCGPTEMMIKFPRKRGEV